MDGGRPCGLGTSEGAVTGGGWPAPPAAVVAPILPSCIALARPPDGCADVELAGRQLVLA